MRHARAADRLQDSIIVVLVIAAFGFAATASRADEDGAWGDVTLVQAPPSACASEDATYRDACLGAAAAIALRR